jgi:hypothetical protein
MSEGSFRKRRPCPPWLLGAFALLVCLVPAPTLAQSSDSAPSKPGPFATFPTPKSDLTYLPARWPTRWGRNNEPIQGVILDIENPKARLEGSQGFIPLPATESRDAAALKQANIAGSKPPDAFLYEKPGSFSYFPIAPKEGDKPRRNEPNLRFRFISGEFEAPSNSVRLQRTWFVVFDPIQDEGKEPRGTALLMPGLFGTPEGTLSQLTTQLRKNGWVVLRMLSQPSRFTEQVTFELNAGNDLGAQAKQIAQVFDDRAAECAFATQAAFQHLEESRPQLKQLPRVAIGFSGGAMTLPTVVARDLDRYSAFILVGGGCDFWLMNQRSNYRGMIDAIHEKWDGAQPSGADRARLDELYLKNAPLDSYHTAAVLKGKRVLMIQGTADLAVPSPLGDLLWERLGKPERWMVDGAGHEVLFMTLPQKFEKMMEWLVPT